MYRNNIVALIGLLLAFVACENDYSFTGESDSISFMADTLTFDTVFTSEATSTERIVMYNRSDRDMTVESIRLVGGTDSPFNVSINGENSTQVTDVRMLADDSLFIFVNVDIPSTDEAEPFRVLDAIEVQSGGHTWSIVLEAYGQNVTRIAAGKLGDLAWQAGRPYLLSGEVVVDSSATLVVEPRTRVYMSEGSQLSIYGTAIFCGTREEPIVMKGSRLESFYDDISGQWEGVAFQSSSQGNRMENVEIAGARYAVTVDSASQLVMENCRLRDASRGAVLAYGAEVELVNSLLYNCGGPLVAAYGGSTSIVHCTLSNYYSWATRSSSTVSVVAGSDYPELLEFDLVNCIVMGNLTDEIDVEEDVDSIVTVRYSLVRLGTSKQKSLAYLFENTYFETDAYFADRRNYDYHLTEKSAARDSALIDFSQLVPLDFDGVSRLDDGLPDIGAFEFVEPIDENIE